MKKKILIGLVAMIVIFAGVAIYKTKTKGPDFQSEKVVRRTITQEVSVTGRVEPVQNVSLSFESGGRVTRTYVAVGDTVSAGDTLVQLNDAELRADLAQARASVANANAQLSQLRAARDIQQAKLDELNQGTRPEEVQVSQRKVANAEKALADVKTSRLNVRQKADVDLENLYDDIPDMLQDAYAKAGGAVHQKIDALFEGDNTMTPTITFLTSDSNLKTDSENQRVAINAPLKALEVLANTPPTTQIAFDKALVDAGGVLVRVRSLLDGLSNTLNVSLGVSATTLAVYKTDLNVARTNVNTALSSINTQKQLIATQRVTNARNISTEDGTVGTAENAYALALDELSLKKAGSTEEQIRGQVSTVKQADLSITAQEAAVLSANATVQNIQAKLAKTTMRSPMNGIVTKQEAKVGQVVSGNTPLVSIISGSSFEMTANIPEADISKIAIETPARVTLDAYGDDVVFQARVVRIDPAETVIEGVSTYSVTLSFMVDDVRIRSGMTANIDMITAAEDDVLSVPYRAVNNERDRKFVRLVGVDHTYTEADIIVGLRGSNGFIQVLSGIQEGDVVITVFDK